MTELAGTRPLGAVTLGGVEAHTDTAHAIGEAIAALLRRELEVDARVTTTVGKQGRFPRQTGERQEATEGVVLTERYKLVVDLPKETEYEFAAALPRHLDEMLKIDPTLGDKLARPMFVNPGGAKPEAVDGAFGPGTRRLTLSAGMAV